MNRIAEIIVKYRVAIIAVFLIAAAICAPMAMFVKVNYNIIDYLPASVESTKALTVLEQEYKDTIPNTDVMVHDVSIPQALEYKQRFGEVEGISSVIWLDDIVDVKQPLEIADKDTVESYYKGRTALFKLAMDKGSEKDALAALQEIVGPDNAVGGEAPMLAAVQNAAVNEVMGAFYIIIPAIIIILALSTTSWIEPLLLLFSIGIAIVLNMGTNLLFDDVSFVTSSVSPILQMAVSLDYAIFLLHSFADYRKQYGDAKVAMRHAIVTSFSTVASSATTTLFGFIALVFMQFHIGSDLGINLAKGIIFSFVTAMVFLPALTLGAYKLIDRTRHRPLMVSFRNIHRILSKLAVPVAALVVIAIVPSFLGQSQTTFLYGAESGGAGSRAESDSNKVKQAFGESNLVVMLVPRVNTALEQQLGEKLAALEHVTSVLSYPRSVGAQLPPEVLDPSITDQFLTASYSRFLIYTDVPAEGDSTFESMTVIRATAQSLYGDQALTLGRSASLYDMRGVVQSDNTRVNLIAIISIFLVLMLTFRSGVLPFLLLFTIETAIWINLAIPYFLGMNISFIGYLVLNTVQLGATVDYAILLTNTYMRNRKSMAKKPAVSAALGTSFKSILVSATTLTISGFALMGTSSNQIVVDIGSMLGRGTLLSFAMVVLVLPLLLTIFDPLIGRLTLGAGFMKTPKKAINAEGGR
jgi:predicted RND superfamily exporter protein